MFKPGLVIFSLTLAILVLLISGCNANPAGTAPPVDVPEPLEPSGEGNHSRNLLGIWEICLENGNPVAKVMPLRDILAHFDATNYVTPPECDDCLQISLNSYEPNSGIVDLDITIRNPTGLTVYDPRGILYTNELGYQLLNADNWTDLWDIDGGENINPFKAYAKDQEFRAVGPGTVHAANYIIKVPQSPNWGEVVFAVDASWPGNCEEPYEISGFHQDPVGSGMDSSGSLFLEVHDWQDDVTSIEYKAKGISGPSWMMMNNSTGDIWTAVLTNHLGAEPGNYEVLIRAASASLGQQYLYDKPSVQITYSKNPPIPVDITPPWLNFYTLDVSVYQGYAYIAAGDSGLYVFDVTDPLDPHWVASEEMPDKAVQVVADDGYAFVMCKASPSGIGNEILQIIDITSPTNPVLRGMLTFEQLLSFDVGGGYLYATEVVQVGYDTVRKINIVDYIDPDVPETIKEVKVANGNFTRYFDGYVYCGSALEIIDVDPVQSAAKVYSSGNDPEFTGADIAVADGIACLLHEEVYWTGTWCSLHILDISDPSNPVFIKEVGVTEGSGGVFISGGYAYSYAYNWQTTTAMTVVDIDPPEYAQQVHTVDVTGSCADSTLADGYFYLSMPDQGVQIIDIEDPESAYIASSIYAAGTSLCISVQDGYAYLGSSVNGFTVVDIEPMESSRVVNRITGGSSDYGVRGIALSGDRAYVTHWGEGLRIYDISSPETPTEIGYWHNGGSIGDLGIADGYAFINELYTGLKIVDIDPPESSYLLTTAPVDGNRIVVSSDGYAYTSGLFGWHIVDIDPPEDTFVVDTFGYGDYTSDSYIVDDLAYVLSPDVGFAIIDIADPTDAKFLKAVPPGPESENAGTIKVNGDYAFICDETGVNIFHINPTELAHFMYKLESPEDPHSPYDIHITGNKLLVTGMRALRLFELGD